MMSIWQWIRIRIHDNRQTQRSDYEYYMVMTIDFADIRETLETLSSTGIEYFSAIQYVGDLTNYPNGLIDSAEGYFSLLDEKDKLTSTELHNQLLQVVKQIANCMKYSSLITEADRRDLSTWIKSLLAALRLRQYDAWDAEVVHDEGTEFGHSLLMTNAPHRQPVRPGLADDCPSARTPA